MSHKCPYCGHGCGTFKEQHTHECKAEKRGLAAWLPKDVEDITVRDVTFLNELYFWPRSIKWNVQKK